MLDFQKKGEYKTDLSHGMRKDAEISLHTLLVNYYNCVLGRQFSERVSDSVTYFYDGNLFCIHHDSKYAIEISGKMP